MNIELNEQSLNKFLRLTNYIGAAQLYLKDNFLLEQPLVKEHLKPRILGHWGTVPGINKTYLALNIASKYIERDFMLVVGPGHGYPALLANLYIEGTLGDVYPDYRHNLEGFSKLIKNFSWPGGFPSHANPETPGVIVEGGELGYALSTSYGAAFDNPNLIVACIVGDGEAETGPTATSWHSNKFLNPQTSGAVLPILHLNKFKISGPTIFGSMSDEELFKLFEGYGYEPVFIQEEDSNIVLTHKVLDSCNKITKIQEESRNQNLVNKPKWPLIILKSKKGESGPKLLDGKMVEDSYRSHGIPLEEVHNNDNQFNILYEWLRSYNVKELIEDGKPIQEILDLLPDEEKKLGKTKYVNSKVKKLSLPNIADYAVSDTYNSSTQTLSNYLRDVLKNNMDSFRIFCPDESDSNKLHSILESTDRGFIWPTPKGSSEISPNGRLMEILSEHTLMGWNQGYTLTGRHGFFISYEAFMMIIASMVDQYSKFLKQSKKIVWRLPVPSLNFLLSSTNWRQDHNGYSHQNPGFISSVLNDYSQAVKVYLPPDANSLLVTSQEALQSEDGINVIVACKRPIRQYLSLEKAKEQIKKGVMIWDWIGNQSDNPDIVFTASGDYASQESLGAIRILKKLTPEIKTRFVYISELTCFGIGDNSFQSTLTDEDFNNIFTQDKKIIYSYHGYPSDIKTLIFNHPAAGRFSIHGYLEQGTTTTPFDMQVQNNASRIQIALEAINEVIKNHGESPSLLNAKVYLNDLLDKHRTYIVVNGDDIPEILNFDENFPL